MPEKREVQDASAADAIEAVAAEALSRNPSAPRSLYVAAAVLAGLLVMTTLWWWIDRQEQKALAETEARYRNALVSHPVAVFLPAEDSVVSDNAERQLEGFMEAFNANRTPIEAQRLVRFPWPLDEDWTAARTKVKSSMETLYRDQGVRIFIVTMSGAVDAIRNDFIKWAEPLPIDDKPILLATVASAPGIADASKGIFRHYIRSRDESDVLATYIEYLEPAHVLVLYVDDTYGRRARDILSDRLAIKAFPIQVGDTREQIRSTIQNKVMVSAPGAEGDVIVIVGYGSMVKNALLELNNEEMPDGRFKGEILVVSTFTERNWRPEETLRAAPSFANRVRTVVPGRTLDDNCDRRGVVFQFAYLTLDRALHCGSDEAWREKRSVQRFADCWRTAKPDELSINWANIELTADGDSHVSLRLLDARDLLRCDV